MFGERSERLIADGVSVDVVDALEVVEIEHHECERLMPGRGRQKGVAKPFVEGAMVPQSRQRICLRLKLETCADMCVVERKGCRVAEPDGKSKLVLGELLQSDAIDVECSLHLTSCDERYRDERLGIGRRAPDETDAGVEVGAIGEDGFAVLDRPPGDPLAKGERLVGQHFAGVLAAREDGTEFPGRFLGLVKREVVVRNQLSDGVGDALEECVERLLGQNVVEDVGEPAVRLDEGERGESLSIVVVRRYHRGRSCVSGRSQGPLHSSASRGRFLRGGPHMPIR